MEYTLVLPFPPEVCQRPRFSRRTGRVYMPHQAYQDMIARFMLAQSPPKFKGPLTVTMEFFLKVGKRSQNFDVAGVKDLTNLCKIHEDAANGILWDDDRQIVSLMARKKVDTDERTIIRIFGEKHGK